MQAISDKRLDPNFAAQYLNRRRAEMHGYEPEEMAGWACPPCFVHQGEPFAGWLWTRRHRAGEGVWL